MRRPVAWTPSHQQLPDDPRPVRRHPDSQRIAQRAQALRRVGERAGRLGTPLRTGHRRRREHRRQLCDPRGAAGARPATARHPVPPQFRPDGGILGRVSLRARTADRHRRRRPAKRPTRFAAHGRSDRSGPRHRVRVAQGPQGHAGDAPAAVDVRQSADLVGDRRAVARLRLLAQSVSGRGRQAPEAVWRDAPFPARDCQRDRRQHHRSGGEPPCARARRVEVRPVADRSA